MSSVRARQLRKARKEVERRRAGREVDARETQRQQEMAAALAEWAQRERHHRMAYAIWVFAFFLAVSHVFEHAGTINLLSSGLEDLLLGWPMAGALAIVGGIVYGT